MSPLGNALAVLIGLCVAGILDLPRIVGAILGVNSTGHLSKVPLAIVAVALVLALILSEVFAPAMGLR